MKQIFFLLIMFWGHQLSSSEMINYDDYLVLNKFLRYTFRNGEFGYVYYRAKPISGLGFWIVDQTYPGIKRHRGDVFMKEGVAVWNEQGFSSTPMTSLVFVQCRNCYDDNILGVDLIHRDLLVETLQKNLALFKYALGPSVTPKKILLELEDPNKSFGETLLKDNVLIGIVLGFGADNCISVSREERIVQEFLPNESPPYKPQLLRWEREEVSPLFAGFYGNNKRQLLASEEFPPSKEEVLKPSFGWNSLSEEYSNLRKNNIGSSEKLMNKRPWFYFGRLKNCQESEKFVRKLEATQKKIRQFLKSPNFFEEVMTAITGSVPIVKQEYSSSGLLTFSKIEKKSFPKLIADSLHYFTKEETDAFHEGFLAGMEDAEKGISSPLSDKRKSADAFINKNIYENLLKAKENWSAAEEVFKQLCHNSDYREIISKNLYVKVLKKGNGQALKNENKVLVHYTLTMGPDEKLLCDTKASGVPQILNLAECFDGLRCGFFAMNIGEEREIMIHPSYAYGLYTTLDKAQYVKGVVKLLDIQPEDTIDIPKPKPLEIKSEFPGDLVELCRKSQWDVGYLRGYQVWCHYKRCTDYSFDQVITAWKKKRSGDFFEYSTSIDPLRVLNRLHWNIYAQEDYKLSY